MSNAVFIQKRAYLCGKILEEYIYENPLMLGGKSILKNVHNLSTVRSPKERTIFSLSRAKKQIRRLVNANVGMNKFLTLTFAENVKDLTQANYEFKKFKQKLERYTGRRLKYICVPEFQKRGAVHYHLMLDMPFIQWQKLSELWGHGRIQIEQIRDKHKTGAYISRYVTKDKTDLRYYGRKIFFYSRNNLQKAIEAVDNFIEAIKVLCYPNHRLMKSYSIQSQFRGVITINFYQLC